MSKAGSPEVDAYIAAAPSAAQPLLRELRRLIRGAAPEAEEKISYGMPFYEHHGRLVYFAGYKNHVGVYGLGRVSALQKYMGVKGTVRLPLGDPLPVALIEDAVKARVRENEAKA